MSGWKAINSVPDGENDRVLLYVPDTEPHVFEGRSDRDGNFCDPVYYEWFGEGATHWMPLPKPPTDNKDQTP